jgi:hypothetical protein
MVVLRLVWGIETAGTVDVIGEITGAVNMLMIAR